MSYEEKDKKLIGIIHEQVVKRVYIQTNENEGVARWGSYPENPYAFRVDVTKDDIRAGTGRAKVRDATLQHYAAELSDGYFDAHVEGDKVVITPREQMLEENRFKSVSDLVTSNQDAVEKDPEIANDPWS